MNREIKFRFHYTEDGPECAFPMEVVAIFSFGSNGEIQVNPSGEPNDFAEYDLSSGALCQYTGLTDRHGKEICEGDILGGSPSWECQRAEVKWESGGFVKYGLYSIGWMSTPLIDGLSRFEVIGNVHENPELLKP